MRRATLSMQPKRRVMGNTRTLDSHAARLRRRLGAAGGWVVNVWGVGYRLVA
jgi:DNA-binding response OmpR family regulator